MITAVVVAVVMVIDVPCNGHNYSHKKQTIYKQTSKQQQSTNKQTNKSTNQL